MILMRQKGIQITVANIKEFCRNGIRDIKDRSKDEASGDDIFGGTKKMKKRIRMIFFNRYHKKEENREEKNVLWKMW